MSNLDDHIFDDSSVRNKASEERHQRRRSRDLADLKKVLSIVEGRRVIWRLLAEAGVFRTSFHAEQNQAYFNMGNQNLGYLLLNDVHVIGADRYVQMQREHLSDQKAEKVEDTNR